MAMLSILMSVYNGERFLRETLDSALQQTFRDFELLVIDDGSTDSTPEILSSCRDPRVKFFACPHRGVAPALNRGLELASGEFVAFLDADDLWAPEKLEAQLEALQKHPRAGAAYSWFDLLDENGNRSASKLRPPHSGNVFPELILRNFVGCGSNLLARRPALEVAGRFDESLTHSMDWDLALRLAERFELALVPTAHVLYRRHLQSFSADPGPMEEPTLRILERACDRLPASMQGLRGKARSNVYRYLTHQRLRSLNSRRQSLQAVRFMGHALRGDPACWDPLLISKMLLRIALVLVLSPRWAQRCLGAAKRILRPGARQLLGSRR